MTDEQVREASAHLPQRQRQALELREGDRRSYEEIAASLEVSPGVVAQLLAHARINLYDELRGTPLATIAAPSPDCERALPLIAMCEDEQMEPSSPDAAWLESHLAGCERCELAAEQMREAGAASAGAAIESANAEASPTESPATVGDRPGRRRATLIGAGAAALTLLAGGLALALGGGDRSTAPVSPAADVGRARHDGGGKSVARPADSSAGTNGAKRKKQVMRRRAAAAMVDDESTAATAGAPLVTSAQGGADGTSSAPSANPHHSSGRAAVEPTQQTSAPRSSAKAKPAPAPPPPSTTSTPSAAPPAESPPAEEQVAEPGRSEEAPGKPSGHPSH